jgi:outer membrane protein assembly factor BamB
MAVNPIPDRRGGLVTVLEDGELLAIDAFGGTRSRRLSGVPLVIAAAEGGILVCHTNGTAELVGLQTGEKAPPLPPLPGFPLAALTRGDRAALAFADGRVLLLSLSEGRVLWTGESHVTVPEETAMLYDERGIYVLTASGASGFTEDGRRLWILRLMGAASLPAFSDEGILYSGGTDWILYAYKLEERRRIQNRSLYGPAPLGSYGVGNPPPFPRDDYYLWFEETELRTRLGSIAGAIAEGRVGEQERAFAACLMWTAGTTPLTPGTGPWIRERLEAIRLLGYMGSRETIPFLAELFQQDPEPVIRAASAEAIGRIGVDPDGLAIGVFTRALFSPAQDERLLLAIARATGALCRFSGPPLSDTGIRILTALGAEDLPPVVQREARRELASLR